MFLLLLIRTHAETYLCSRDRSNDNGESALVAAKRRTEEQSSFDLTQITFSLKITFFLFTPVA